MTVAQKIVMWIFGLMISFALLVSGLSMNGDDGNLFVALVLPLVVIGVVAFLSFSKKHG